MKNPFVAVGSIFFLILAGYFFLFRDSEPKIEVKHVDKSISSLVSGDLNYHFRGRRYHQEEIDKSKQKLEAFLMSKMRSEKGFYTNYLSDPGGQEHATGHDQLSESSGLYLVHLALTGTKAEYDTFYQDTKELFYENHQFSYRVTVDGKRSAVNASLDDLRIMRSLLIAGTRFNDVSYQEEFKNVSKYFVKQSMNDGLLTDFYDSESKKQANEVSFFYLDYSTLGKVYQANGLSPEILQYQLNLTKKAKISSTFPLYQQKYNYKTQSYESGKTINILESLITILYLAEIGEADSDSLTFIKENVEKGTLFNSYNQNGEPVDTNQSAASYAFAAMIGFYTEDRALYQQATRILQNFQVTDSSSEIYGGIGDPKTLEVYSFNNLVTLLTYDV
ncbi:hypothetical protein [Enterococcus thailandicus]|uniref:hypothetical protein n=1 Tax=Enterococcus thailandicus TaxID=417368 RepID=UPI002891E807|nr:hypothetical protein [Enterococcus thailandicus]MDT2752148.1 hypothetical protein [Enterococcus thailandicus]MDT2776974.1 hypothetical protein [Enterococcus thailandicus]MDT2793949.1 hypothetical protein [Enterococcus thailandicus]